MSEARQRNGARRPAAQPTLCSAVLLSLVAALGCTTSEDTVTLEVYSWWQEQSEQDAFEAVRRVHRDRFPNVEVRNLGETTSEGARQSLASRMLAKAPPASFQANLGANLLSWTVVDIQPDPVNVLSDSVNSFRLIQGLSGFSSLSEELRPGLFAHLVVGGSQPFGVPINVHRLNVIYYRPDALLEFQGRRGNEGKSFLNLGTLCPEGDYEPDHPDYDLNLDIVIGAGKDQAWTLTLLTLENVLPALVARRLGGDMMRVRQFYEQLFSGEKPLPRDATGVSTDVRAAFECVQYLSKWFRRIKLNNKDDERPWDESIGWAEAVDAVKRQGAAFTVMGDWASGLLEAELAGTPEHPAEVESRAFPGTDGLFVYTSDTFPLPRGTEHPREAEELLRTIASNKAQVEFSREKGSIPALKNADLTKLNPWQRAAAEAFETSERLLATSGFFPPYYPEVQLQAAIKAMAEWDVVRPDADDAALARRRQRLEDALRIFTNAEETLAFWQARLEQGVANAALP